jgi:hypothetical protein
MGLARLSTQRQNWRGDFDKDFYTYSLPLLRWICASLLTNPARNHTRHIIAAITVKIKTTHSLSPSSLDLRLSLQIQLEYKRPVAPAAVLRQQDAGAKRRGDWYTSSFSLPFFAGFGKTLFANPARIQTRFSAISIVDKRSTALILSLPFFAGLSKQSPASLKAQASGLRCG